MFVKRPSSTLPGTTVDIAHGRPVRPRKVHPSEPTALRPELSTMHLAVPTADPEAARFWCQHVRCHDVDEQADAQPLFHLRYEQLSAGRFSGELTLVALPGLQLVAESANQAIRQRGAIGAGRFGLALTDPQPGEAFFNGQPLTPTTMMVGRSEGLDMVTPAGCGLLGVTVEHGLLDELWQQLYQRPLAQWLVHQSVLQLSADRADELRRVHRGLLHRLQAACGLRDDVGALLQLRDDLLLAWIEAIPGRPDLDGLRTAELRKSLVDRACVRVLAQPAQPMSILALCRAVGTSPRKLAYCFREVLGTSPARYLRSVRLNGVRRDLKRPRQAAEGVHEIATRWGFWNLGEFAGDYRRQFGELPSETLRRARGVAVG
jgi:AraC family transcriptional regulator, ethanolamine operon transcriptional activator